MRLSVKERILALRVLKQLRLFPDTAAELGVEGTVKRRREGPAFETTVSDKNIY